MSKATRRDDQTSSGKVARNSVSFVDKRPQFEIDLRVERVSQCAILQHEEQMKETNKKLESWELDHPENPFVTSWRKKATRSSVKNQVALCTRWATLSWSNWDKPRRLFSVCILPLKHVPEGCEHVSMWRLASTQSKYDGPNQRNICSLENSVLRTAVTLSRGKKHGHNQWHKDHAKRGARRRGNHISVLSRWQNDEIFRASQVAIGWTETYVKYLDFVSTVDIKHEAPYRERHRFERHSLHEKCRSRSSSRTTAETRRWWSHQHACSCQPSTRSMQRCTSNSVTLEDKTAQHIGSYSPKTLVSGWVSTGSSISRHLHLRHGQKAHHGGALNGKIKSGGTSGKNGQRQIHGQTGSGKLVAGEYCLDCCQNRHEFQFPLAVLHIHQLCSFTLTDFASRQTRRCVQISHHRTDACAHFSRCVPHLAQFTQCACIGSKYLSDSPSVSQKSSHPRSCHLRVPEFSAFLPVFTSSTTTPTPLTGIRLNPCATPLCGGPSGHLADPTPNTGSEPKFCIDGSSERTPTSLPTWKSSFKLEREPWPTSTFQSIKRQPGQFSPCWN